LRLFHFQPPFNSPRNGLYVSRLRTVGATNTFSHLCRPVELGSPYRRVQRAITFAAALPGHDFNFHEHQILITAIDGIMPDPGGPEVCYTGRKLGS
jgi:hypothetical protein